MKFSTIALTATLLGGAGWGVYEGYLPAEIEIGQVIQEDNSPWAIGEYNNNDGDNAWGFVVDKANHKAGDKVLMIENRFGEIFHTFNLGHEEIITETFVITDITAGMVRGEPYGTTGEGIYYDIELFDGYGVSVAEGDIIEMGWLRSNYLDNEWDRVSIIKKK